MRFINQWDKEYEELVSSLPLFDVIKIKKWNAIQIKHFVKTFYHVRGHFYDVLWLMGNFVPNEAGKNLILKNIVDELGGKGMSHEQLFHIFAEEVGVDAKVEMMDAPSYLPFLKEFNQGYLQWLSKEDWEVRISAFTALERLDNTDYKNGKLIAETLGVKKRGLAFFNVHMNSRHFDGLAGEFSNIWEESPEKAAYGFNFVKDYQSKMWKNLSDEIVNYA